MASLRGIEQFFMQVRRRYSLLERTLNSASRVDRIWNIYSPYNPVVIQRLLNIYRVFYNYAKRATTRRRRRCVSASPPGPSTSAGSSVFGPTDCSSP
jgi:hypothetical protein